MIIDEISKEYERIRGVIKDSLSKKIGRNRKEIKKGDKLKISKGK
jgi:hypothetical protein